MIELKTRERLILTTRFGGDAPARLIAHRYAEGGRLALTLVSDDGIGEPLATITTNLPEVELAPGEVIIKDWSENEGMEDWVIASNIAYPTGKCVRLPFGIAPIVRLKAHILEQLAKEFH